MLDPIQSNPILVSLRIAWRFFPGPDGMNLPGCLLLLLLLLSIDPKVPAQGSLSQAPFSSACPLSLLFQRLVRWLQLEPVPRAGQES